ncbi:hypothetical protein BIV57_02565 [Mangrovactinospora gilvigrisea]|uniref:F420-dependent oxidoreductase n=1 Tax=Mangrovactinospora gilvigrisea TaxID=1428644 RepID=A0A1J7CBX0_9ACTN|nr:hypothetical protein BIV57_02565 [Mangrovactinospora gilvigrisea]
MHVSTGVRGSTGSRVWHGLLLAVALASLVWQFVLVVQGGTDVNSGAAGTAAPLGTRILRFFSYFTIESNILVAVCAFTLLRRPDRDGPGWRVLRLDTLLGIGVTGLVYGLLLAPKLHLTGEALVVTAGLHYVTPPATLLGWLLFGPRGRIDRRTVGWAFLWPVAWIGWTLAHGAASGWYPYPFLDVSSLGYGTAVRNIVAVLAAALVGALLLVGIDRALNPRDRDLPSYR